MVVLAHQLFFCRLGAIAEGVTALSSKLALLNCIWGFELTVVDWILAWRCKPASLVDWIGASTSKPVFMGSSHDRRMQSF